MAKAKQVQALLIGFYNIELSLDKINLVIVSNEQMRTAELVKFIAAN